MKRVIGRGSGSIGGLAIVVVALLLPASAQALVYPVLNTNDTGDNSLRKAIMDANNNPGPDTININANGAVVLQSALPAINDEVDINGPGQTVFSIDGNDLYRPLTVNSGKAVSISGLTLTDGLCDNGCGSVGGGILNNGDLTLSSVTLSGNTASADGLGTTADGSAEAGGIENVGTLTLVLSTVSGNTATATGFTNQGNAIGAGIRNDGIMTMDRSTVSGNTASVTGGVFTNALGGGIFNTKALTLTRSTVSGNTATGTGGSTGNGAGGGGISNSNSPSEIDVTIDRSTLSGNTATATGGNGQGGGVQIFGTTGSEITSSTISHNTADSGSNLVAFMQTHIKNTIVSNPGTPGENCLGTSVSDGYNLTDTTCNFTGTGDQQNADPMLGALGLHGGPTENRVPQVGGDAVDQGLSSAGETVDQRGLTRPSDFSSIPNAAGGDGTDVGAVEVRETDVPETFIDSGPSGITNDPTPTFTFHSSEAGSTFRCDTGGIYGFSPCTSPVTRPHLADGTYGFAVFARDSAGNQDASPASRSYTVKTAEVKRSGSTLVVTAAPGAKDNLQLTKPSASTIRVTDLPAGPYSGSGVHTVAGSGCTRSGDYTVNCNAGPITQIRVSSGAGTDRIVDSVPLPAILSGGAANDVLTGGPKADTIIGGGGADTMKGMNGNDLLRARDLISDTLINCDGGPTPGTADTADLDLAPKDPNSVVLGCETKTRH